MLGSRPYIAKLMLK